MNTLQVLVIGLGLAGYYALVAVGFALIFATLRIFHIAHGTMFISAVTNGSFTITHANSATAGRTFLFAVVG